jgi:hypothetical protein
MFGSGADLGFFVPQSEIQRGIVGAACGLDWAWSMPDGGGGGGGGALNNTQFGPSQLLT